MGMTWNADKLIVQVTGIERRNVERAAIHMTNKLKEAVNQGRSPPTSAEGSPPNRDSGLLLNSITYEITNEGLHARIGTPLIYGGYLEWGTRYMAARPWLRPTLEEQREALTRILATMNK